MGIQAERCEEEGEIMVACIRGRKDKAIIEYLSLRSCWLMFSHSVKNLTNLWANVKFLSKIEHVFLVYGTWLKEQHPYSNLETDFGELYCLERDPTVMGKSLDGGLCLYVYKSLCNTVLFGKHHVHLTLNLSVTLQPYYLQESSSSKTFPGC